jgi:diguanylate cyclase (GGDEF)-like protein
VVASESLLKRHFAGELAYYECEARMRHKNGSWIWVLDRGKVATWTDDGKPLSMSGTHLDITDRKLAEEQIRHMATHDALTGLATLRLAEERLAMTLGMARRQRMQAAVMFIDLDGFKAVNDSFGHDAGDEVLREVAKRLTSSVRETDTVARVGGDEFLFIAGGLRSAENATLVAEKLVRLVAQPMEIRGKQVHIGASIGIAISPDHGAEGDALIKRADEAMYRVKNSGKCGFALALAPLQVQASRSPSFPGNRQVQ